MVRELTPADTIAAQKLLRARPLHNVFLDHVVSAGILGRIPGFLGYISRDRLEGMVMVGPLGGTTLEVCNADAHEPLAEAASRCATRPRHIVGSEDVTAPFWSAYQHHAAPLRWTRREPVYVVARDALAEPAAGPGCIEAAGERDLEQIIENSALQHCEDLADDRCALDPAGFRQRHEKDVLDGRWWVLRERGRVVFQVHVGAENAAAVQIGGVMTPPDLRNRGYATRGVSGICARLLERRQSVILFCDEANTAARHVYERVGFKSTFHYWSWLVDEPLIPTQS